MTRDWLVWWRNSVAYDVAKLIPELAKYRVELLVGLGLLLALLAGLRRNRRRRLRAIEELKRAVAYYDRDR